MSEQRCENCRWFWPEVVPDKDAGYCIDEEKKIYDSTTAYVVNETPEVLKHYTCFHFEENQCTE